MLKHIYLESEIIVFKASEKSVVLSSVLLTSLKELSLFIN
jgi:hypothetical protein